MWYPELRRGREPSWTSTLSSIVDMLYLLSIKSGRDLGVSQVQPLGFTGKEIKVQRHQEIGVSALELI